jgi:Flp pilus assembly protein TadB
MRRIRLSTLMLLIVIAALIVALVMERNRSARLERQVPKAVDMQARLLSSAKTKGKAVGGRQPAGVEASEAKEGTAK